MFVVLRIKLFILAYEIEVFVLKLTEFINLNGQNYIQIVMYENFGSCLAMIIK